MIFVLIVAAAAAAATWLLGWWAVAIVAIVAGFMTRTQNGRAWRVALGSLLGWSLLMLIDAATGPMSNVAKAVSGAMSIPAAALIVVTLLFPALIGWSGATLGALGGLPPKARARSELTSSQ